MTKFKTILAAMLWNKKSNLRPWAIENPIKSVVLCVGYTVGIYTISMKFADMMAELAEKHTEKLPVVEVEL